MLATPRATEYDPELNEEEHHLYRTVIGKLMWTLSERPDLAYPTKELKREPCRHLDNLTCGS
eukprot:13693244-Heterocapsa_arctica.AAC.1